jgi:Aspartyl/Asparaginyl beta-hydroxylase
LDNYHTSLRMDIPSYDFDDTLLDDPTATTMERYGIDHLECQWKKIISMKRCDTTNRTSNSTSHSSSTQPSSTQSSSIQELHLFVAGTLLDHQQYALARQYLFRLIMYHLVPQISGAVFVHSTLSSLSSRSDTHMDHRTACTYQLLSRALQEYIATYEEEGQQQQLQQELEHQRDEISHRQRQRQQHKSKETSAPWIIGRRIAALRNSLPQPLQVSTDSISNGLVDVVVDTRTLFHHHYWNTTNLYQRPPFYYPIPQQLQMQYQSSSGERDVAAASHYTSLDDDCLNYHNTPVLHLRHYHPPWCQQLECYTDTILKELQSALGLSTYENSSSSSAPSSLSEVSSTTTATSTTTGIVPQHLQRVGSNPYRINDAGKHDGSIVNVGGDWREIVLFSSHYESHSFNDNVEGLLPQTKQLIQQYCYEDVLTLVDTGIGEVIISVLGPQTYIAPHTASHNVRYTAHLPLIVPTSQSVSGNSTEDSNDCSGNSVPNCYIRIGEEICTWEVGKMLIFDDSYEHEVVNDTNEIRVVLLLRFWHPLLRTTTDRTDAIQYLQNAKFLDQIQRCNPPIPFYDRIKKQYSIGDNNDQEDGELHVTVGSNVQLTHLRCREETNCQQCHSTGYTSVRVVLSQQTFICACGQPL